MNLTYCLKCNLPFDKSCEIHCTCEEVITSTNTTSNVGNAGTRICMHCGKPFAGNSDENLCCVHTQPKDAPTLLMENLAAHTNPTSSALTFEAHGIKYKLTLEIVNP